MARYVSTHLFNLINKMGQGEKRYFKQHVRNQHMQGKLNYVHLFDAITKQKEYNEEKIVQLGIVKKEHLPMLKNYLYTLILESMRVLHSKGDDIDSKLSTILEITHIMREKGLAEEEMKFLKKAKELAFRHERWGTAIDVLMREIRIMRGRNNFKHQIELEKEMKTLQFKLNNVLKYLKINRYVLTQVRKSGIQRIAGNKMLHAAFNHPLLRDVKEGQSVEAKKIFYDTLVDYYFFIGDYRSVEKIFIRLMPFIESNYSTFEFPELTYSSAFNNLTITQCELGKYAEALSTIQKHRSLLSKSEPVKAHIFIYSLINETNYYLLTKEFEKGAAIVKNIEKKLDKEPTKFQRGMPDAGLFILYYNIAVLYFGVCEYHRSLAWINKIINHPKVTFREDIQARSRILQLLIHYELNTPDILQHLLASAHRFLLKRKLLYNVEEALLHFIDRLRKTNPGDSGQKAIREEFQRFKNELVQITKDPEEKKALLYFDLISWLESKIKNRPFVEIEREKAELIKR